MVFYLVVFILLGDSPASVFMRRLFGTLCSIFIGRVNTTDEDGTECSETSAH